MITVFIILSLHGISGMIAYVLVKHKSNHFDQFHPLEVDFVIPLVYGICGFFSLIHTLLFLYFNKK